VIWRSTGFEIGTELDRLVRAWLDAFVFGAGKAWNSAFSNSIAADTPRFSTSEWHRVSG
jgi:hypothetical protein